MNDELYFLHIDNPMTASTPVYPMTASAPVYPILQLQARQAPQHNTVEHVRAIYPYAGKRKDELNLQPGLLNWNNCFFSFRIFSVGDIIILLERRSDQWCKGNLDGRIGLFPGNYVEEM